MQSYIIYKTKYCDRNVTRKWKKKRSRIKGDTRDSVQCAEQMIHKEHTSVLISNKQQKKLQMHI